MTRRTKKRERERVLQSALSHLRLSRVFASASFCFREEYSIGAFDSSREADARRACWNAEKRIRFLCTDDDERMRFLVAFILGAAILTTTLTNNGVSCSDDIVQKEDGGDIVVPKVHVSRHFTTSDSKTGFPFALDPAVKARSKKC